MGWGYGVRYVWELVGGNKGEIEEGKVGRKVGKERVIRGERMVGKR